MLLSMEIVWGVRWWYVKKMAADYAGATIANGNKVPSGPILKNVCPFHLKSKKYSFQLLDYSFSNLD